MTITTKTTSGDLNNEMKRDWDDRAREDAKWFINCSKLGQTEEEFDATGLMEVQRLITADLPLLIGKRDPQSLRLLEIGSGIGRMTKHLAGMFGEIYATDVSAEMIRQARQRLQSYSNVYLYETNGIDFNELPEEYFDLIFSAYVFQHVPTKEIILSNIRDAYRLLKPGCVFKFVVNGVSNDEFRQMTKDTWMGTSLLEEEICGIAREIGAQLVSLIGLGTQYCWTILRKPRQSNPHDFIKPIQGPCIIEIGCSDDMGNKVVPSRGDKAYVGLIVKELDLERVDANNLIVELQGRNILPCYVGLTKDASEEYQQVTFQVPEDHGGGCANVLLRTPDGTVSNTVTVTILPAEPIAPKIRFVSNCAEGGVDVFARGPKSKIRLHTEGLDKSANTENVCVHIGGHILKPESITFVPVNADWLVTVQLPEETEPGDTEIHLNFNNLDSPAIPLHIKEITTDPH